MVGLAGPELLESGGERERLVDAVGVAGRPVQRRPEVAELGLQLVQLGVAEAVHVSGEVRGCLEVVVEMASAPIGSVAAAVEKVSGVLADGFEQPVAGFRAAEVDRGERSAHELVEHLDRPADSSWLHTAVNAARSQPPAKTLIALSAAWADGVSSS